MYEIVTTLFRIGDVCTVAYPSGFKWLTWKIEPANKINNGISSRNGIKSVPDDHFVLHGLFVSRIITVLYDRELKNMLKHQKESSLRDR